MYAAEKTHESSAVDLANVSSASHSHPTDTSTGAEEMVASFNSFTSCQPLITSKKVDIARLTIDYLDGSYASILSYRYGMVSDSGYIHT